MNYKELATKHNIKQVVHHLTFMQVDNIHSDDLEEITFKAASRTLDEHGNVLLEENFETDGSLKRKVQRTTNDAGKIIEVVEDFEGTTQRFTYEYDGDLVKRELMHYEMGGADTTEYTWNGELLQSKVCLDEDGEESFRENVIYDDEKRIQEVETYQWGAKQFSTEYEYDDQGKILKEIHANGEDYIENEVVYTHNEKGQIEKAVTTDADDFVMRTETHEYDEEGLRIKSEETFSRPGRPDQTVVRNIEYIR